MSLNLKTLSPHIFWDVDIENLSVTDHWRYIIVRVIERGSCEEIRTILIEFGGSRVREAVLSARNLNERTISFFANMFAVARSEFRAYRKSAIS